jgi:transposase
MKLSSTMTIGCDLGDRKSDLFIMAEDGTPVGREKIATTRQGFQRFFAGQPRVKVVCEASTHSAWVSSLLKELGHEPIVANPRRVLLIAKGKAKSDAVDAELLARLGRADPQLLSPIEHRGQEAQRDLAVIRGRALLVETRTGLINHVRSIVKSQGERVRKCTSKAFVKVVRQELPKNLLDTVEPVLVLIDAVNEQIHAVDCKLDKEMSEKYREVSALKTVDGVGTLTALTYTLTIDDPNRFSKSRNVGSYVGLSPGRRQSGNHDPELHITRCGDRYLRTLLITSAHRILGPFGRDSDLRRWGLALAARGQKNAKKRAIVAVARRLAVLLHRMSLTGEVWVPCGHQAQPQAA